MAGQSHCSEVNIKYVRVLRVFLVNDGIRAGIAMIFLTSVVFSLSFGPVSWVLASEVRCLFSEQIVVLNAHYFRYSLLALGQLEQVSLHVATGPSTSYSAK